MGDGLTFASRGVMGEEELVGEKQSAGRGRAVDCEQRSWLRACQRRGETHTPDLGRLAVRDDAFTSLAVAAQYMQVMRDDICMQANNASSMHPTNQYISHHKHHRSSFLARRRRPSALIAFLITAAAVTS